jgi:hypothetical protein
MSDAHTRRSDIANGSPHLHDDDASISPIVAASLCIKPRGLLTPGQAAKVDALKSASADFTAMRRFAMRFRGILRSKDIQKFGVWLNDAQQSGIYAMQRFARTLRRDLDAVTNALTEGWSNGQTEGHINRLKTLKRAMYGRASTELLRARMCHFTCRLSTIVRQTPPKCPATASEASRWLSSELNSCSKPCSVETWV